MDSADEHGIIHSDACTDPLTDRNELPGGSGSATSKYVATLGYKATPSDPSKTRSLREHTKAREEECWEETSPVSTNKAITHTLLGALGEFFEVARPEIAASGVVASICKVWQRTVPGVKVDESLISLVRQGPKKVAPSTWRAYKVLSSELLCSDNLEPLFSHIMAVADQQVSLLIIPRARKSLLSR